MVWSRTQNRGKLSLFHRKFGEDDTRIIKTVHVKVI